MSLPLEAYVTTAASLLRLDLPGQAQEAIAANLANLQRLSDAFAGLELEDELDPAPVYRP